MAMSMFAGLVWMRFLVAGRSNAALADEHKI